MGVVTLQFLSVQELWNFRLAVEAYVFETNLREKTLTYSCKEQHIQLATEKFAAKVIKYNTEEVRT